MQRPNESAELPAIIHHFNPWRGAIHLFKLQQPCELSKSTMLLPLQFRVRLFSEKNSRPAASSYSQLTQQGTFTNGGNVIHSPVLPRGSSWMLLAARFLAAEVFGTEKELTTWNTSSILRVDWWKRYGFSDAVWGSHSGFRFLAGDHNGLQAAPGVERSARKHFPAPELTQSHVRGESSVAWSKTASPLNMPGALQSYGKPWSRHMRKYSQLALM